MRLEPCAVKVASTVLRGGSGSNATSLPDYITVARRLARLYPSFRVPKSRWHKSFVFNGRLFECR